MQELASIYLEISKHVAMLIGACLIPFVTAPLITIIAAMYTGKVQAGQSASKAFQAIAMFMMFGMLSALVLAACWFGLWPIGLFVVVVPALHPKHRDEIRSYCQRHGYLTLPFAWYGILLGAWCEGMWDMHEEEESGY